MSADVAGRIAAYLSQQDGIRSATVAAGDGGLLASAGDESRAEDAALVAFICDRAEQIAIEGDLRGMGKLVTESEFEQLAISGPKGEGMAIRLQGGAAVLVRGTGLQLGSAAQATTAVANRYGRAAGASTRRNTQ